MLNHLDAKLSNISVLPTATDYRLQLFQPFKSGHEWGLLNGGVVVPTSQYILYSCRSVGPSWILASSNIFRVTSAARIPFGSCGNFIAHDVLWGFSRRKTYRSLGRTWSQLFLRRLKISVCAISATLFFSEMTGERGVTKNRLRTAWNSIECDKRLWERLFAIFVGRSLQRRLEATATLLLQQETTRLQ